MRPVFHNPELQEHFSQKGWVKVPLLSADEISALNHRVHGIAANFSEGFSTTFTMAPEIKEAGSAMIKSVCAPRINEHLIDYRLLNTAFVSKGASEKSAVPLHQHMSLVDETQGLAAINFFCPLLDTNELNGNLHVVSGTHLLPKFPRADSRVSYPHYGEECWRIFHERAEAVPTKAGEAIVFDNSLIHGSPPNRTRETRIVALLTAVPIEAEGLMYFSERDDRMMVCAVDEAYMSDYVLGGKRPDKVLGYVDKPNLEGLEQRALEIFGAKKTTSAGPESPVPVNSSDADAKVSPNRSGLRMWLNRLRGRQV